MYCEEGCGGFFFSRPRLFLSLVSCPSCRDFQRGSSANKTSAVLISSGAAGGDAGGSPNPLHLRLRIKYNSLRAVGSRRCSRPTFFCPASFRANRFFGLVVPQKKAGRATVRRHGQVGRAHKVLGKQILSDLAAAGCVVYVFSLAVPVKS